MSQSGIPILFGIKKGDIMSKNRKSFIYIIKIDKVADKISLRVYRIMRNKPHLIGNPEMDGTASKFCALFERQKKGLLRLLAKDFLIRTKQIKEGYIEGKDYLLEAV